VANGVMGILQCWAVGDIMAVVRYFARIFSCGRWPFMCVAEARMWIPKMAVVEFVGRLASTSVCSIVK
jgi:hypothetical protein